MIKVGRIFSGWWRKSVTKAEPINQLQSAAVKNDAADTFTRMCECRYSYDPSGFTVFGDFPENYVFTDRLWVDAKPAKYSYMLKKMIPEEPAHWSISKRLKPCYFLDYLYSHGKGQGTRAVKDVVMKSLNDTRTQGRVVLQADIIDGKTSPAGFYYKLGFRFANDESNKVMQNWLKTSGRREDSPMETGMMFLPAENIKHCLNY